MSKNKSNNKKKSNKKKSNKKNNNDDISINDKLIVEEMNENEMEINKLKKDDSLTEFDEDTEINISDLEDEEDIDEDIMNEKDEDEDGDKEDCFYSLINSEEENDEIDSDISEDEDNVEIKKESIVKDEDRITKRILSKYEYVRLLSDRTIQLSQGAKSMISNTNNLSYKEIADLEIRNKVIPLIIERPLPNGLKERFKINELKLKDIYI